MERQTPSSKQQGFSLIELLVVVAIIGVLAAAGIVGYTSYLEGVKKDTHKNNAITLGKALNTTGVARGGGLTVSPAQCADAADGTKATAAACAAQLVTEGKFKSPWGVAGDYIATEACGPAVKGRLSLVTTGTDATLSVCDNETGAMLAGTQAIAIKFN